MYRLPLICCVCGDRARGMNFNAMTCMSCKTFFRRHALRPPELFRCKRKNYCKITKETRNDCAACRLQKCFAFGMKRELIRSYTQYKLSSTQIQLPMPKPLGLLQNDRSALTFEQWNLLSNIIHIYDNQNIFNRIKSSLTEESSLPIKLRAKPTSAINYMYHSLASVQSLLKQCPDFHTLPMDARRMMIKNNIYFTSALNSIYIGREIDLGSNSDFEMSFNALYGPDYFTKCSLIPKRLDPNSALVKIMLFIILFSSNYSIVTHEHSSGTQNILNSIILIKFQDLFADLLWKYLIYQYGFRETVLRYSSLIKTVLDNLYIVEEFAECEVYQQMLDMIVLQTDRLLIIDD